MAQSDTFYVKTVKITYEYLGPAADRFLARQIRNHLQISPAELDQKRLLELLDWIRLAMLILTDDERLVEKYISELHRLAHAKGSLLSS